MNLGLALRRVRMEKYPNREKSQSQIAKEAGISQTYLSQIEGGAKKPSLDVIESLCKVYGIPVGILTWFAIEKKDIQKGKLEQFEKMKSLLDPFIRLFIPLT